MNYCKCGYVHAADEVRAMYRFCWPVFMYRVVSTGAAFSSRALAQQSVCPHWTQQAHPDEH